MSWVTALDATVTDSCELHPIHAIRPNRCASVPLSVVRLSSSRDVAQLGSASVLGTEGRRFKSCHPDDSEAVRTECPGGFLRTYGPLPRAELSLMIISLPNFRQHRGQWEGRLADCRGRKVRRRCRSDDTTDPSSTRCHRARVRTTSRHRSETELQAPLVDAPLSR